jgi:putative membrane protein
MILWPTFNAILNGLSALLLLCGYYFIRHGDVARHRLCQVSAFTVSTLFLISYLLYHHQVGSVRFTGTGTIRTLYFTILISHSILAVVIVPLILRTLFLAAKGRFVEHRLWARWTLPLWLYVSVTGVIIYGMLYLLP